MRITKKFNTKIFLFLLGLVITFIGFCFIPSSIISFLYNEPNPFPFLFSIIISLSLGLSLLIKNKNYPSNLSKRDGRIIVGLIWIVSPFVGALPYLFSPNLFTIENALFESFSGFTTTGSSVIKNIEEMPKSILLWRAITQWIGGLGFLLFVILFMKNLKNGSNFLFNAEFTSIDKEKVHPHIRSTVIRIFYVYFGLTGFIFILLLFGSMDVFTAFYHSAGVISTGGFSTLSNNIGGFSAYNQYVIMLGMFLAGISYIIIYRLFKRKFKKVYRDEQFRIYILIMLISSIILFTSVYSKIDGDLELKIRTVLFNIISVVSTTGYEINTQESFGNLAIVLLIILMFIGGSSASSSTGLKIIRFIILAKFANVSFKRIFHSRAVIPVRYNKRSLNDEAINLVFGFFFLYLLIFLFGAFLLTVFGNEFLSSITLSAANISNIGPVIGIVSPDVYYYNLNTESKITLMILMMVGRLEIYSFFILFSRSLWLKN
ncbi:MAG: potassium transporter TrkG [Bacteroidales bacterium]